MPADVVHHYGTLPCVPGHACCLTSVLLASVCERFAPVFIHTASRSGGNHPCHTVVLMWGFLSWKVSAGLPLPETAAL